jgi:hypothetical protein
LLSLLLLLPAGASSCVSWRQTGGCDPAGPREPQSDLHCDAEVPRGSSGYCECADGSRVMQSTCEHMPFRCDDECRTAACPDGLSRTAEGTCANPASPAPGQEQTAAEADPLLEQSYRCLGWRQTHGCDANGRRDLGGDRECDAEVPSGASGFCECIGAVDGARRRVRLSSCDHMAFSCAAECSRAKHYACDGWRQTGNCSADGPREPALDLPCDRAVPAGFSGFCECGGGARKVARAPGCNAADDEPAKCASVCVRGESLYEIFGLHDGARRGCWARPCAVARRQRARRQRALQQRARLAAVAAPARLANHFAHGERL